jgi:hypothetical protein
MVKPGDHARWYANQKGWKLLRRNMMVEGNFDVGYFELASRLYFNAHRLHLVGNDLSVFSPGTGDRGGTSGVFEEFPPLWKIIQTDCDSQGKLALRIIALLDNDHAGRSLHRALLQQYRQMKENRDVFLLQRNFPRSTAAPSTLSHQIETHDMQLKGLYCEIEDLLSNNLIDAFISDTPNALQRPTQEVAGFRHHEWTPHAKDQLSQFVKKYAILEDMEGIIEVLKAIRFYLALDPNGVP